MSLLQALTTQAVLRPVDAALANTRALEFLTGYLIEKSLAVDNIFVFLMIFTYFAVPPAYQKRVLMIGIVGAIVLRTVMILVGGWLIASFHWVLYLFGAFLLLTGIKMWWAAGKEQSLDDNPALKLLRRVLPVSKNFDGERFWTVENGTRIATPLLMVVALVGLGLSYPLGWIYDTAVAGVALLLVYEHALIRPDDLTRVNIAFFHVNVIISLALLVFGVLDLLV